VKTPISLQVSAIFVVAALLPQITSAQMIPRFEIGVLELQEGRISGLETPKTVKKNEVVWTSTVRPASVVTLLDGVPKRPRPGGIPAVAPGTQLFGLTLFNGMAYCPVLPVKSGVPKAQCFRDIDGDGTFDGAYVGNSDGLKGRFLIASVYGLVPIPKRRYEAAAWDPATDAPMSMIYAGADKGVHQFRKNIDGQKIEILQDCVGNDDDTCTINQVTLRISAEGEGVRIELASAFDSSKTRVQFGSYN
jgi:hypothetical protein